MIPTKEEWEEAWKGLDERYAFDHFYGKTLAEAESMLRDLPGYYCEDFTYMPKIPFRFYFEAYKNFLLSPKSYDDYYAAISFLSLVESSLEDQYDWIKDDWPSILRVLNKLADEQDFYGALTPGEFREQVDRIIKKQSKLNPNHL